MWLLFKHLCKIRRFTCGVNYMGYVIGCYAPRNHGKTTTIKTFCDDLEKKFQNSHFFKILHSGVVGVDIVRAYKYYGLLVFVISAGDEDKYVKSGYETLRKACNNLNCDILICAATQNDIRQTQKILAIESAIENIARNSGHWMEWISLRDLYNKEEVDHSRKVDRLSKFFDEASENISRIKNECRITDIT